MTDYANELERLKTGEIETLDIPKEEFLKSWISTQQDGEAKGSALLLQPTPDFLNQDDEPVKKSGFRYLMRYLAPYRRYVYHLILGLALGSIIQFLLPFLF